LWSWIFLLLREQRLTLNETKKSKSDQNEGRLQLQIQRPNVEVTHKTTLVPIFILQLINRINLEEELVSWRAGKEQKDNRSWWKPLKLSCSRGICSRDTAKLAVRRWCSYQLCTISCGAHQSVNQQQEADDQLQRLQDDKPRQGDARLTWWSGERQEQETGDKVKDINRAARESEGLWCGIDIAYSEASHNSSYHVTKIAVHVIISSPKCSRIEILPSILIHPVSWKISFSFPTSPSFKDHQIF
jgi:hypothetical protein